MIKFCWPRVATFADIIKSVSIFIEKITWSHISQPTLFSNVIENYSKPKAKLRKNRFRISIQGASIWNNFLLQKKNLNLPLFLNQK